MSFTHGHPHCISRTTPIILRFDTRHSPSNIFGHRTAFVFSIILWCLLLEPSSLALIWSQGTNINPCWGQGCQKATQTSETQQFHDGLVACTRAKPRLQPPKRKNHPSFETGPRPQPDPKRELLHLKIEPQLAVPSPTRPCLQQWVQEHLRHLFRGLHASGHCYYEDTVHRAWRTEECEDGGRGREGK